MFIVDRYLDQIREKTEAAIEADKARRPYEKVWHVFDTREAAVLFLILRAENELTGALSAVKRKTKRLDQIRKKYEESK